MTEFMNKSFSVYTSGDDSYRDRWEETFGKPKTPVECVIEPTPVAGDVIRDGGGMPVLVLDQVLAEAKVTCSGCHVAYELGVMAGWARDRYQSELPKTEAETNNGLEPKTIIEPGASIGSLHNACPARLKVEYPRTVYAELACELPVPHPDDWHRQGDTSWIEAKVSPAPGLAPFPCSDDLEDQRPAPSSGKEKAPEPVVPRHPGDDWWL